MDTSKLFLMGLTRRCRGSRRDLAMRRSGRRGCGRGWRISRRRSMKRVPLQRKILRQQSLPWLAQAEWWGSFSSRLSGRNSRHKPRMIFGFGCWSICRRTLKRRARCPRGKGSAPSWKLRLDRIRTMRLWLCRDGRFRRQQDFQRPRLRAGMLMSLLSFLRDGSGK